MARLKWAALFFSDVMSRLSLYRGERQGVEMRNTSRCAEIDKRFPGLIAAIVKAHNIQLAEQARRQWSKA